MRKTSNKLNILLIAITLLLVFVTGTKFIGSTHSWLTASEQIGFTVTISDINIKIKQSSREISNNGNIYIGANYIEADKPYALNVTVTNEEDFSGYYIRFQAFAVVNGTTYNINEYITTDFYKNADGWAYNTASSSSATPIQMASKQTKTMLNTMTIPATASAGKLSISTLQGKHFKLFLYVEGSPSSDFTK